MLCLTGSDLFFNQSLVNFRLTAHETSDTPILSAILYIDKNIANKVAFKLYISGPYYLSENVYYINYFDSPRLRLQAGKFNGNRSLVFNVSSDMSECSAGMRTFVMVPVNVYTLSLVGSFHIDVSASADARKASAYRDYYHHVKSEGMVDSGKNTYNKQCIFMCSTTSGSLSVVLPVCTLRHIIRYAIVANFFMI